MEGTEEKLWYEEKVSEGLALAGDRDKLKELQDFFYNQDEGRLKFKEFGNKFRLFTKMMKYFLEGKYDVSSSMFVNSFAGLLFIGSRLKNYGERLKSLKFIADLGVLVWILKSVDSEVEKFQSWQAEQEISSIQIS